MARILIIAAADLAQKSPVAHYGHDMMMVLDLADGDSIYFHKDLWLDHVATVRHGRSWGWAKRVHERYWEAMHR
jgi:hypothetical protein